jgi:cbb3-type cytochrome oxidase maturation protein
MNILLLMLPGGLFLALLALAAFFWALRTGQFDEPDGDVVRALLDDERPGRMR